MHGRRDLRQHIGPDRRDHRDLEPSGKRIPVRLRDRHDFVTGGQNEPGTGNNRGAGLGERCAAGLPFDQLHAQILFEFLQLRRQRRLADETALGSLSEMAGVGHGDQVAKIL